MLGGLTEPQRSPPQRPRCGGGTRMRGGSSAASRARCSGSRACLTRSPRSRSCSSTTTPTRYEGLAHRECGTISARRATLRSSSPRRQPRCQQQPRGASGLAHARDGVAKGRRVVLAVAAEPGSRPGGRRSHGVRRGAAWRLREVLVGTVVLLAGGHAAGWLCVAVTGLELLLLLARRLCLGVSVGVIAAGVAASEPALLVVSVGVVRLQGASTEGRRCGERGRARERPSLSRRQGVGGRGRRSAVGSGARRDRHDVQRGARGGRGRRGRLGLGRQRRGRRRGGGSRFTVAKRRSRRRGRRRGTCGAAAGGGA